MKITDEAKVLLQDILKKENFNCVIAGLMYSCSCGDSSVQFGLGNIEDGDQVYTFNDIKVVMEEETLARTELITIYVENGELMFLDEAEFDESEAGCGCGHDHQHDHQHEHDDCGCGHDHHHEAGEDCGCGHEHADGEEGCCGKHNDGDCDCKKDEDCECKHQH